jgi:hypothetical protein
MNTRPIINFPTPKPAWIPHRGSSTNTYLDLLVALAAIAFMAVVLFSSL